MFEDGMVREADLFIGEITDDFGYRWIFVKPRATELKDHFTLSTMYQGSPIYGWVKKFPNWEDRRKEVESYEKNHEARADVETIHTTWSMKTLISKYGPVQTIRELKKRCDAGAIVGCSMYLNFSLHLIEVALENKDPAWQAVPFTFLEAAEGDRWVNRIKEIHAKYPDRRVPKNVIGDIQDEFREDLEHRVGRPIPRLPGDATKQDIMLSKKIAEQLSRGTFIKKPPEEKPRPPPVAAPTIPMPVEKMPETKPELELMKKEIEERIKAEKKRRGLGGGGIAGEPAGEYRAGDDRTKIKYLEDILVKTFITTQGRNPTIEEMQVIKQRTESLIRKYGTYTYKGLENAIYASLSIEDLGNMMLAIHASNLAFDDKKKLVEKIGERMRIFKGGLVEDADESRPGNGFQVLTTLPGGVTNWEKTQKLVERLKRMGITVDVEPQYFTSYQARYSGDAPEFIVRSILKVPQAHMDKANYFMTDFMKSAGFEVKEDQSDYRLREVERKLSKLPEEERKKIIQEIWISLGKPMEPGKVITLDIIAGLSKEERIKIARILMGPEEKKKEVISPYTAWTFEDFKTIINRITNLEDLLELEKHISESKVTTPRQRIQLMQLVAQRETEIRKGGPELRKQIEEQQREQMAASVQRLRENKGSDMYSRWTYDDFNAILNRTTNIEDLMDLAEHIEESRMTPGEKVSARLLVKKRKKDIVYGTPEIKRQIEEQQMMGRLAGASRLREDEVREDADEPIEPRDYTQWTFSDFETFIPSLDSIDELEELYEYVGASDKVTEPEGDMLRDMITRRLNKLRGS